MSKRSPNLIERIGLALAGGYIRESVGDTIDPDDDLYRPITSSRRNLSPIEQERAQKIALHLWRQNAMGHRLTEMIVDFVVGDGIAAEATDDRVQEVIDQFWNDPVMNLAKRHRDFVRDQSIYGELAFRTVINPVGGRMRMGFIDVNRIKRVELDAENALVDRTLLLYSPNMAGAEEPLAIINYDDSDPANPKWGGEAFYFAINRVTGQSRGTPDVLAIADFMDGYDQILFNQLERTGFLNAFVWDVELTGQDQAAVDEWLTKNSAPPRPGSVRAHNEKEKWEAVSPSLGSSEAETVGRQIKNMVLGGAGVPEAWFADGDSANRATLAEQGDPTYRMLQTRQRDVKEMFERILQVVVERAIEGGRLPSSLSAEERVVTVNMPDPSTKDTSKVAAAIVQLANGLMAAVDAQWISKKSARKVFLSIAGQLGVELDPTAEEEQIDAEQEEQAVADEGDDVLSSVDQFLAQGDEPVPADEELPDPNLTFGNDEEDAKKSRGTWDTRRQRYGPTGRRS